MRNIRTALTTGLSSQHLTLTYNSQGTSIFGRCQTAFSKNEFGQCEFWAYESIPTYLHIGQKSTLKDDGVMIAILSSSLRKLLRDDNVTPGEIDRDIICLDYLQEQQELHISIWTTDAFVTKLETIIQNNLSADFIIEFKASLYNFKDVLREELPVPTEEEFRGGETLVSLDDISISFKQGSIAFGNPDDEDQEADDDVDVSASDQRRTTSAIDYSEYLLPTPERLGRKLKRFIRRNFS